MTFKKTDFLHDQVLLTGFASGGLTEVRMVQLVQDISSLLSSCVVGPRLILYFLTNAIHLQERLLHLCYPSFELVAGARGGLPLRVIRKRRGWRAGHVWPAPRGVIPSHQHLPVGRCCCLAPLDATVRIHLHSAC